MVIDEVIMWNYKHADFEDLKGMVISAVWQDDETVTFKTSDLRFFEMYHDQDCCESVYVESVVGDWDDIIDVPLLLVEEVSEVGEDNDYESSTWTFYKMVTMVGGVTIRWLGQSNGYYSESVSFSELEVDLELFMKNPDKFNKLMTDEERALFLLATV